MKKIPIEGDGAKWGISDWYSEVEEQILAALTTGEDFETGWYGSKREIASGWVRVTGAQCHTQASVSDDFDTEGRGEFEVTLTGTPEERLCQIQEALDKALELAGENQKDNEVVVMFKILHLEDDGEWHWVETYLQPMGDGHYLDHPPGDYYHDWGFQGERDVPEEVKRVLVQAIETNLDLETFQHNEWQVKLCN